jgi:hypothetical protein
MLLFIGLKAFIGVDARPLPTHDKFRWFYTIQGWERNFDPRSSWGTAPKGTLGLQAGFYITYVVSIAFAMVQRAKP